MGRSAPFVRRDSGFSTDCQVASSPLASIHLDQPPLRKRPSIKRITVCEMHVRPKTALMMGEIEVPPLHSECLPNDHFQRWTIELFEWKQLRDSHRIAWLQREHEPSLSVTT